MDQIKITKDIYPVTELKRHTKVLIDQAKRNKRPIILTMNGTASAVLMDAETYEEQNRLIKLSSLLLEAEKDILENKTRPTDTFFKEFKNARQI